MGALIDDTAGLYVTDDSPNAEARYRARFYFDPNSISMASGDTHYLFKGYQGTSTEVIRLEFRFSSGSYQIRAGLVDNGSTWSYTSWFTISDASHYLEWDWRAASSGGLTLWLDGAQQADLTNITNDTRVMDRARLGPLSGLDTGTSGTYYFDSFESRRANYIGPMAMGNPPPVLADTLPHLGGGQGGGHFASYHLAPPQQGGTAFTPVADAYVAGDATTTNYGASTTLRADASPDLNSYLRFDVQGLTGSVTSATLRIYANSASSTGYTLHSVSDNTWTETGITYSNAPAMGSQLGASGAITAGTWTTVDVTSYITGNGSYNLAFTTTSNTNTSFSSREGANPPELIIVTSGGATNTPTATNTPGPSPTPTRTPTPGITNTPTITPTAPPSFSSAAFVYDGDGKRVKSAFNGTITTYFVGAHYEVTGSTVTKYYYAGAQRIAMRSNGALNYLLGDHLGSTSLTTDASGNVVSELRYKAWGEVRYASGDIPTKYQFNGQYSHVEDFGLMFYNARWVDVSLGRFAQADIIIPDPYNSQAWDRYAYALNNPLRYTDPTGHSVDCGIGDPFCSAGKYKPGGLIALYRQYFGDDAVRMGDSNDRERLSAEIEDYMSNNPDYDPFKDSYLPDPRKRKREYFNFMIFTDIREDYWRHRQVEAGNGFREVGQLMAYYDFHKDVTITEWNASRVDWVGTGLDSASFTAAIVALCVAPEYAIWANTTSVGFGAVAGGRSAAKGDYVGGGLSVGGFAKPPFGTLLSGISIIRDLSTGFYTVPYIPPFER